MDVEIVVIKEILRDSRDRRAQGVSHGEQQNAGQCGLLLIFHPVQVFFEGMLVVGKEEAKYEKHPGKSQRTDDDDIEGDTKSAHGSPPLSRPNQTGSWVPGLRILPRT